jgi:hypothetical protein
MSSLQRYFALLLLFLLFWTSASAQWLSAGATGGVPISPHSAHYADVTTLDGNTGPNDLLLKPYVVGAVIEGRLPIGFSLVGEFDYTRMHQDFTFYNVKFGAVNFGTRGSTAANVWLFPMLVRYNIGHRRLTPFVDAGATLRHLGDFTGSGTQLDFFLHPQPITFHTTPGGNPEIAVTAGAGVRTHIWRAGVSAELRFLHWTTGYLVPAQNQGMLQIALMFPARR